jgi:putative DNA primase/helicase
MSSDNSAQQSVPIMKFSTPLVERPRWLWPQRIPLGNLTLLAGEPQAGKSYLTLDLAARVSRGGPWPGAGVDGNATSLQQLGPGSVLMVCIEDSWRDTVCPRLEALGADMSKIRPASVGLGLAPSDRVEFLFNDLYNVRDCRLIVIDPISVFMNELGGTSGSRGRKLVYSLAEGIRSRATALVMVTHLRAGKGKALHLASGSDALVRAARSVWLLGNDPVDSDRRIFLPIKNNLAPLAGGLAFALESVGDGEFARLQWDDEPVPMSADDFLSDAAKQQTPPRDHRLCKAVDWLQEVLRDASQPAGEIQRRAKTCGISYGTLRRAFDELGVESLPKDAEHPCRWQLKRPEMSG